ncbi:MAG TPA: glycosyltransferase family 2 protein [Vicinamibacterales bacterium]|nr:glycosyltransferase family 2 protein [Vicinamibacterales bacterium]
MRLSVVVVNWNSRDHLRDCLASLAAQSHRDLETIVVDNGSTDGSAEMVAADFASARLVRLGANLGFAEGCNRGIAASSGPWVATLNNDTVADPEWARSVIDAAAQAPAHCGMLQSLMLFRERPGVVNSAGLELTRGGAGRDRWEERPRPPATDRETQEIFCPTAGAAAYRREMLDAIHLSGGWFDRDHFMYFEDLDLGWRGRLAGWTARYVPTAVVFHTWHGSVGRHGASWLEVMASTNRTRTLVKNASPLFILGAAPELMGDIVMVTRHGGLEALGRFAGAVRHSLKQRDEVSRMIRVSRREVERIGRASGSVRS